MKLKSLIEAGDPERLATGFQFLEGPVWHPDGYLLFSDIPAARIYKWSGGDQAEVWRDASDFANGNTLDREQRLLSCEHRTRRVSRTAADGSITSIASHYDGKRLNSPNDIVVKSDGTIYFTDPPYGQKSDQGDAGPQELPWQGVYRVNPDGSELTLLLDDFERPNGLAFSPDESILYIGDSPRRHVRAFDVRPDGTLAGSRVFADMDHPQPGSPDGMKIDQEGHLYVAGATGIWIFEPDGTHLGVIVTPERPANCAWGDADRCTLYVTARTSLYRIRAKVPGCPVIPD